MRTSTLTLCLAAMCMLASPIAAASEPPAPVVEKSGAPARRAASADELERYAERERAAEELQKFEGGRGGIEATTLVIILLVVILVVIII